LGAVIGFFAGLLGVGGGMMSVTILAMLFGTQGFAHEHILHLALGTGFATILFTAASSIRAHHEHRAVRWDIFRRFAPPIVVGTLAGASIASRIPTRILAWTVVGFVGYTAVQMFRDAKPKPARALPGPAGLTAVGLGIGVVCSLVAAGGAFLTVPFMLWCNVRMHQAIGTSAALGFPIAVAGTAGYVAMGWGVDGLPGWSLGYVYVPALIGVVALSVLTAPIGARIAHRTEVSTLRRIFALVMLVLAVRMAYGLL